MKYFMLSLASLPLLASCTTMQEEYYGPYDMPPSSRAEVHRHVEPGYYPNQPKMYSQRGAYHAHGGTVPVHRASRGSAVITSQRNHTNQVHGHTGRTGRTVIAPQNSQGHSSNGTVSSPNKPHGHSDSATNQNTHGHAKGTAVGPRNDHGHNPQQNPARLPPKVVKRHPSEQSAQVQNNAHGHQ